MEKIQKILLNVDEVEDPPKCLLRAGSFAKALDAELDLAAVVPSFDDLFSTFADPNLRETLQSSLEEQTTDALERLTEELGREGITSSYYFESGAKANKLISLLLELEYDILIKDACSEEGANKSSFGAVDRKLIRHCRTPIWIVREQSASDKPQPILAAVDAVYDSPLERELNLRLLEFGRLLADSTGAELHILHAWRFESASFLKGRLESSEYAMVYQGAKEAAEKKLSRFLKDLNFSVPDKNIHLARGMPSECIVEFCRKHRVDTLVLGSVGRSGFSGILVGNTAERVVHNIDCSVLVVSPKQFKSPLEKSLDDERQGDEASV